MTKKELICRLVNENLSKSKNIERDVEIFILRGIIRIQKFYKKFKQSKKQIKKEDSSKNFNNNMISDSMAIHNNNYPESIKCKSKYF